MKLSGYHEPAVFFGSGGGGGGGDNGPPGPPTGPPPKDDCPELTSAILCDVPRAGNASTALSLAKGAGLTLVQDGDSFRVDSSSRPLGWLPKDKVAVVERCMVLGYSYSASLREASGNPPNTRIEVILERSGT